MKKIFFTLVLCFFASAALQAQQDGGTTGDLEWSISGGTLTISGTGDMPDYHGWYDIPWYSYQSSITRIDIGEGVTSIGNYAFYSCNGLTAVTIPNSVTTIGESAFNYCHSLTAVTIPNSVETIGYNAFNSCYALTSVIIGNSVETIGDYAFVSCSGLTSVAIPNSVKTIGDYAFASCYGLTSVIIGNSVETIGDYAFNSCYGLVEFINLATTPQTINSDVFGYVDQNACTLYVSAASLSDYQNENVWKDFINKVGVAEASNITVTSTSATVQKGATQQFTANVTTQGAGVAPPVKWTVTNNVSDFTTINSSGILLVGLDETAATLTITATSVFNPTKSGVANVDVTANSGTVPCNNPKAMGLIENFVWILCPDGTLTISGTGEMPNYGNVPTLLSPYINDITHIVIGEGITSISDNAFQYLSSLTSVAIPNSVETIGNRAFYSCIGLTSVSIPNSVAAIGNSAFEGCYGLISVTIPNSVETIGEGAFRYCYGLTSVTIPNSVETIGNYAFAGCNGLTSVTIPNSVETIGNYAFAGCNGLTEIVNFAETPQNIDSDVFYNVNIGDCALHVLAASLQDYQNAAVWKDFNLSAMAEVQGIAVLPATTGIEKGAKQKFTADVTTQGTGSAPVAWTVTGNVSDFTIINSSGVLLVGFDETAATLNVTATSILDPTKSGTATVNVTESNGSAPCSNPKAMGLTGNFVWILCPDGTLTINGTGDMPNYNEGNIMPWYLYSYTSVITRVVISEGVTSIGDYAFAYCYGLTSVTIPNSVTTIGDLAFAYCYDLTSVTIPNLVTTIGDFAFAYYDDLTEVVNLADEPQDIYGKNVFDGVDISACTLYVPNASLSAYQEAAVWKDFMSIVGAATEVQGVTVTPTPVTVQKAQMRQFTANVNVQGEGATPVRWNLAGNVSTNTVISPNGLLLVGADETAGTLTVTATSIIDPTKSGTAIVTVTENSSSCNNPTAMGLTGNLAWILCPDGTLTINGTGDMPDYNNWDGAPWSSYINITSVDIGAGVTSIGNYAFEYLHNLNSVAIGNSVTTIREWAFYDCDNLASVSIPNSVESIGEGAFSNCYGLTSVTIGSSVETIGNYAFYYCNSLNSVSIPNSVETIGNNAFFQCDGLTSVSIPNSVESIGDWAFYNCSGLTEIINLATTPQTINSNVFVGVNKNVCTLSVPDASLPDYQNANVWKDFYNIMGITPVAGISLDKATATLAVGDTEQLTAKIEPADATNQNITWSSSDTEVATVSNTGEVTAVAAGVAIITVTTEEGGETATCEVTVVTPVTSVSLNKTATTLTVNDTEQLTATIAPTDATNQNVMWNSDNSAVATVSNGLVMAVAAGTANITVTTADGGYTETCAVTVQAATVAVTGVSLNKTATTLAVNDTEQLTATVQPTNATNQNVTWNSNNTAVATVNNGLITAVAAGTANITVTTADGGYTATCTVTVQAATVAVTGVSLNKTATALTVNDTEQLTATLQPTNATNQNVTWNSSNTAVATVNNGLITAVAAGTANITVTTADGGYTATCAVTVNAAPVIIQPAVTSVTVSPSTASVPKGQTQQFTATVTAQGGASTAVTWSVAGGIAGTSINSSGLLTVAADETATTLTITATSVFDPTVSGIATVEPALGTPSLVLPDLKVSPNPFTEQLRITGAEGCTMRVMNAIGAVLHVQKITSPDETIRLEKLLSGIYFLRLEKDGKVTTIKVIRN